jgi:hypothetical protein
MAYKINAKDINATTDVELAFSTVRLLPKVVDIPQDFFDGNIYTEVVEAIFYGKEIPESTMILNFEVTPEIINKCITAHLKSFEPKHENKIAGVGYLLSKIATIELTPATEKEES